MNNNANTKKKIIRLNKVLTECLEDISKRTAKTQMTINRQQQITTRLLQSERADQQLPLLRDLGHRRDLLLHAQTHLFKAPCERADLVTVPASLAC